MQTIAFINEKFPIFSYDTISEINFMCPKDFSSNSSEVEMPSSSSSENPGSDVVINDDNFKQFKESSSPDDREKSRISVSPVENRPCSSAPADEEHGKRLKL